MNNSRRSFAKACGLGALGATGLLPMLQRSIQAQGLAAPKRILLMFMPNTSQRKYWLPTGGRDALAGTGDASTFTLNQGNAAFERLRQRMTFLEGINVKVEGGDLHSGAQVRFMTGGPADGPNNLAGSPSIDQLLLSQSPTLGAAQFGSLELICDTRSDRNDQHHRIVSYDMNAQPLPGEVFPHLVHQRLFGNFVGGMPSEVDTTALLSREQSILDFVKADLAALEQRVPAAEKQRLQAHLAGLREVEGTVAKQIAQSGTVEVPGQPPVFEQNVSKNHPAVIDAHLALVKAAFQFDLTRIVTFSYGTGNSYVNFDDFLGPRFGAGVHGITHGSDNQEAKLLEILQWYTERSVKFIEELANTPEPDGTNMLDNTLVVFWSEVSQFHEHDNVPVALFGGEALGLKHNRMLSYKGRYTNDIWTSLSPLFGVDMPTFGTGALNGGALPELV